MNLASKFLLLCTTVISSLLFICILLGQQNSNLIILNSPKSYEVISGIYLLNASTSIHATNVTFYYSRDEGKNWIPLCTVINDTYPDTEFTCSWNSSLIKDGSNLWFNATGMNETHIFSTTNTNITVANTLVSIEVKERATSRPIGGARVLLNASTHSLSNFTDENGIAYFFIDSTSLYNITVIKEGYFVNSSLLFQNFSVERSRLIFLLGNSTLKGWVKDPEGIPMENVNVSVFNSSSNQLLYSTLTDANGYYCLRISGSFIYYINFSKPGYHTLRLGNFSGSKEVNATIYPSKYYGTYIISVFDIWNLRPIPNANVTIIWSDSKTGFTDLNGSVSLVVPANTSEQSVIHNFYVSADGYKLNSSVQDSLREGDIKHVVIFLEGSNKIFGWVKDGISNKPIEGAFIELWDDSNQKRIGWDGYYYNVTTDQNGYYSISFPDFDYPFLYVHANASGYNLSQVRVGFGSQQLNISLYGSSTVKGKFVDSSNQSYPIPQVLVKIKDSTSGDVLYAFYTDENGKFQVPIKSGLSYYLEATKAGYENYVNPAPYSNSHDYGIIQLTGKGLIKGKVIDYQNNSIVLPNTSILLVAVNGPVYSRRTDQHGEFSIKVMSGVNYSMSFEKLGYEVFSLVSEKVPDAFTLDLGSIQLKGKSLIEGFVFDEGRLYPSKYIEGVKVILKDDEGPAVYSTYTNSSGFYSLRIPSTISNYTIFFEKEGYKIKIVQEGISSIALKGATHIEGKIFDYYNNKPIENAEVQIIDSLGNVFYSTSTNSTGHYSLDIGVDFNFFIKVIKENYLPKKEGFTKDIGFPYDRDDTGKWDLVKDIGITGNTLINITTIDAFSRLPVGNSFVCIAFSDKCEYTAYTDYNGNAKIYIEGGKDYYIKIDSPGYPSLRIPSIGTLSGNFSDQVELPAQVKVRVLDKYATSKFKYVPNANVSIYYFYNVTEFNYTLEKTIVNINVSCIDSLGGIEQRDGIKVRILDKEKETSNGNENVTFERIPAGLHVLFINGSDAGCVQEFTTIFIPEGGRRYDFTFVINSTRLRVKVVDPLLNGISGAILTLNGKEAKEIGNGVYEFEYITPGVYTVSASKEKFYSNSTSFKVRPTFNDYTDEPIILIPYPGTINVFVEDDQGNPLDKINVTVFNSTSSHSILTLDGWANFTGMVSLQNIIVDGRTNGYSYFSISNFYVEPEKENIIKVTLHPTKLTIYVTNKSNAYVENVNVTIWNLTDGKIARSVDGTLLTALTSTEGKVEFSRIAKGNYNITLNKTGYSLFNSWLNLTFIPNCQISRSYKLETTSVRVEVYDMDTFLPLEEVEVILENETHIFVDLTNSSGIVVFNLNLAPGSYNLSVNGSSVGYNWSKIQIQVFRSSDNPYVFYLKENVLKIEVKDVNGKNVDEVKVSLKELNVSGITSKGKITFHKIPTGLFTIIVNGSEDGYGINVTQVNVKVGTNYYSVKLNITKLIVHVFNSTNDQENILVVLVDKKGNIAKNGKGDLLANLTDNNGEALFEYLPLGKYNITIEKFDSLWKINSTLFVLDVSKAGKENYVEIDPSLNLCPEEPNFYILFRVTDKDGNPIKGVNVIIEKYGANCIVNSGKTNSSGEVELGIAGGIYNFIIDGESVGFGKYIDYFVPTVRLFANAGKTDSYGMAAINIDGRTSYYITIDSFGYNRYDELELGITRSGTSYLEINLIGNTNLTGYVYDKNFVQPIVLGYEPIPNASIKLHLSSCDGEVRYEFNSNLTGGYFIQVSSRQPGSSITQHYCIEVSADGYSTNYLSSFFEEKKSYELPLGLEGAGKLSGYVKKVVTEKPIPNATIIIKSNKCYGDYTNCVAYKVKTSSDGSFMINASTRSLYLPYSVVVERVNYITYEEKGTLTPPNSSIIFYLMPASSSVLSLNVIGEDGLPITSNVSIKWLHYFLNSSNEDCVQLNNTLKCIIFSSEDGRLIINGSEVGYGVFSGIKNYSAGKTYVENIVLNLTLVNLTLTDDEGEPINGLNVTLYSLPTSNTSVNGSVIFKRIPIGVHRIQFSGNLARIYFYGKNNSAIINVTKAGKVNLYEFVFNETRYLLRVLNESYEGIATSLSLINLATKEEYRAATDLTGYALLEAIPYGNYSLILNVSNLLNKGYNPISETIEIKPGLDEFTGNNKTLIIHDIKLTFNVTNSTSPLQNINLTLYLGGMIATNGFGIPLAGLTNASGLLTFRNVRPSSLVGEYVCSIDGNRSGYGILNQSIWLPSEGYFSNITLNPLSINISVKEFYYNVPVDGNITIYTLSGDIAKDVFGNKLTKNTTNGTVSFSYLYAGSYNVTFNSTNYTFKSKLVKLTYGTTHLAFVVKMIGKSYPSEKTYVPPSEERYTEAYTPSYYEYTPTYQPKVPTRIEGEVLYILKNLLSKENVEREINSHPKFKQALISKLGLSEKNLQLIYSITPFLVKNLEVRRSLTSIGNATSIVLTFSYHGPGKVTNLILYDTIPKSIARKAEEVKVITDANVYLLDPDPSYMFVWNSIQKDRQYKIEYYLKKGVALDEFNAFQPPLITLTGLCGNNICDVNENWQTCCIDCGCPEGYECKNNVCQKIPVICGNGICETGETPETCCIDCGCPEGYECKEGKCVKKVRSVLPIAIWIGIIGASSIGSFVLVRKLRKKPTKVKIPVEEPITRPAKPKLLEKEKKVKKITLKEAREKIDHLKRRVKKLRKRLEKIKKGIV